jgi:hypothetical protein
MQHVQALHPVSLATTRKQVAKTLAEKEQMNVRPKQAKLVLNMRNGITKKEYRNSFKELEYFKNYLNTEGNARMDIRWRTDARGLGLPQNGNKYFEGYEVCASGIRNVVTYVGIPFFSFDACFSKHLYYKGRSLRQLRLPRGHKSRLTHECPSGAHHGGIGNGVFVQRSIQRIRV